MRSRSALCYPVGGTGPAPAFSTESLAVATSRGLVGRRSAYADPGFRDHREATSQGFKVVVRDQTTKHAQNRRSPLIGQPQSNHSGVRARRIRANVGKAEIKRDEHSLLAKAGRPNLPVGCSYQLFAYDRLDIVTCIDKNCDRALRDVLVELDLHAPVDNTWTSCFASQAP